jgi:hypothetical protein
MSWVVSPRGRFRRRETSGGSHPRWVRAMPGRVPHSPLESRVAEILAAHPVCRWDYLVSEVAEFLRRSEPPILLTVLDEVFWGEWLWPAVAREELHRLEGVLLTGQGYPPPPAERPRPDRAGRDPSQTVSLAGGSAS